MIDISPDVQIRATLRPGSVFYFCEETHGTETPHYFVVLNHEPLADQVVVLACASSQVEKVRRRTARFPGTLVEVTRNQYLDFTADVTAFDSGNILTKTVPDLVRRLASGELRLKSEMPADIVANLRAAVKASPTVDRKIKALL